MFALVALLGFGLGIDGFRQHLAASGEPHSASDVLYRTLQLFVLESGWDPEGVNWELQVARLVAPVVAAYAAVQALGLIFREQLQLLRVRFWRDHVVICGLGRKGALLAAGFRARKEHVVVIERDEGNRAIARLRERGIPVLIGEASDPIILGKARVFAAKYLIAVCGEDGTNADVAAHTHELVNTQPRRGRALDCFVHVVDLELCGLLRDALTPLGGRESFRIELFNIFESGARAWVSEHSPFEGEADAHPHLVVVGIGQMGMSLIVEAVRTWLTRHAGSTQCPRPRITIVDREAERRKRTLLLTYPQIEQICELVPCEIDVRWPEFGEGGFLSAGNGRHEATAIYLSLDDDVRGVSAGLDLARRVREHQTKVVVRTAERAGLAAALGSVSTGDGAARHLIAFPLLDLTCTPEQLLGETPRDLLARGIHADYLRHEAEKGETRESNRAMVAWEELPESLKESNRRQADHIGAKLRAVACRSTPLDGTDAGTFALSPEEEERIAELEHRRWMAERLFDGWKYAPGPKNLELKTSPDLIPWEQLSESEKNKDRAAARDLPAFLARAGFRIKRLNEETPLGT